MISKFLKTTALLLIGLLLQVALAHASGKMEVRAGQKVTLKAEQGGTGDTYKWVVKRGKDILGAQTGTVFSYQFDQAGEYQVNLTTTNRQEVIRTSSVAVMVGSKFKRPEAEAPAATGAAFTLTTLPPTENGQVRLIGEGDVLFHLEGNPDILEYRVDENIFADSDKNGTANDDVDNASDESYLRGGYYKAHYAPEGTSKVAAEVTAVARDGSKTKKQVEIAFGVAPSREAQPFATVYTIPAPSRDDGTVYLYGEEALVGFYAETSAGNLIEYRIDKNIFFDSNGDGDPANDIDNLGDPSFRTGDVWTTTYQKTDGQLIAQLIVVTADGKGSRLQRSIKFFDKPPVSFKEYEGQIRLTADKPFVRVGDPVEFRVQGLALALDQYTFAWDFDGDGTADQEIEADNAVTFIYETAGPVKPQVLVTDKQGNSGTFSMDLSATEGVSTAADFEFTLEGNTVTFTNKSTASEKLANPTLIYQWNFADIDEEGYKAQKDQLGVAGPTYTYYKAGTYQVTLTVTDVDSVTDTQTAEIVIEQDLDREAVEEAAKEAEGEAEEEAPSQAAEGAFSILITVLKVLLYIILVLLILAVVLFGGFFVFYKIKHPDLTFDELIDEMKLKILHKLGLEEELSEHAPSAAPVPQVPAQPKLVPSVPVAPAAPAPAPKPAVPAPAPEPKAEIIEGEVIVPPKHPPATGELAKPEGPVPDWLKGL